MMLKLHYSQVHYRSVHILVATNINKGICLCFVSGYFYLYQLFRQAK